MSEKIRVTVWNEFRHERQSEVVKAVYPGGIHTVLADYLESQGLAVKIATLDEPNNGLMPARLDETDVLLWWGHKAHGEVEERIVDSIQQRVLAGMGLIVLHSAHFSKIFKRLMGTSCDLK